MILYYRFQRLLISVFCKPFNLLAFAINHVKCGKGFCSCGRLYVRNWGTMQFGNGICINSHRIADPIGGDTKTMLLCGKGASLILHDGVSISNCTIFASNHIEIQNDTCIGGGAKIYDTDFHSTDPYKRLHGNTDVPSKPVHIGKRVFIGGHSIILKGVTIGDEAVIGAGSVVTKDVPAREIWAGNPARFIKKIQ